MPSFPRLDLADFDLSKIELPDFSPIKLPDFKLPDFDLPKFEMPKFEMPNVELPEIDLPSTEQITGFARDAAYVSVGLAVMTVERVQAFQQQLLELLKSQVAKVREAA